MTTLSELIRGGLKPRPRHPATATPATPATPATVVPFPPPSVATVASVAVANLPVDEKTFGDDQGKTTLAELIRGTSKLPSRPPATTFAINATQKGEPGRILAVANPLGDKSLLSLERAKPTQPMPPAVRQQPEAVNLEELIEDIGRTAPPHPTIKENGILAIPFNSHPKYHWWNGGQSIATTLAELGAGQGVIADYGWRWKE